jgi:hypothetical protein
MFHVSDLGMLPTCRVHHEVIVWQMLLLQSGTVAQSP